MHSYFADPSSESFSQDSLFETCECKAKKPTSWKMCANVSNSWSLHKIWFKDKKVEKVIYFRPVTTDLINIGSVVDKL